MWVVLLGPVRGRSQSDARIHASYIVRGAHVLQVLLLSSLLLRAKPRKAKHASFSISSISRPLKIPGGRGGGMAKEKAESVNCYEEARKQRLEDNLKRFEDLGILKLSKTLSEISNSGSKHHHGKPRPKKSIEVSELRRSSRERNVVTSYREVDVDLRCLQTSRIGGSSSVVKEGRIASYEERLSALENAEKLQSKLKSGYPSFIKSMVRSHVYSCFWLGLPRMFCKDHLPTTELKMILEDENGSEYDAIYLGRKTGLSGGWRAFALDHQLDDGDALVFELTEPTRFKVYIIKACDHLEEEEPIIIEVRHAGESKRSNKMDEDGNGSSSKELQRQTESMKRAERAARRRKLRSETAINTTGILGEL